MSTRPSSADVSEYLTPDVLNAVSSGGFDGLVGLVFTEVGADRTRARLTVEPKLHQPYGILHGGVHCAFVEALASTAAALWYLPRGRVVGVSNTIDFLRSVEAGTLYGEATPIHRGSSQQLWQVVIRDEDDRLVARGQVRLQNLPATAVEAE